MPKVEVASLTAIILTKNESIHLVRCLKSLSGICERVFVVDSWSTDETLEIAAQFPFVEVVQHEWVNYSQQLNWAIDNCPIQTDWVLRMDADEYFLEGSSEIIRAALADADPLVSGFYLPRQVHFLGRWIKHGGVYPTWLLRIWRRGKGRCENRWMDEHIVVDGATARLQANLVDDCLKDLSFFTNKHNGYSSREAVDLLALSGLATIDVDLGGAAEQAWQKRWLKEKIYSRLPLFWRALAYFFMRYFLLRGFLDGREGLIFHGLQGFWYRFLVDAKVYEYRVRGRGDLQMRRALRPEERCSSP